MNDATIGRQLRTWRRHVCWSSIFGAACGSILQAQTVGNSNVVVIRRSYVGTAYSAAVEAQAEYVRAYGEFLRSAAVARDINADAYKKELENSKLAVSTFFERRRMNREYREAEHPGFLEQETKRTERRRDILRNHAEINLQGDLTNDLNWMLEDMLVIVPIGTLTSSDVYALISTSDDMALEPTDVHHIRLSEGQDSQGRARVFRADTAEMLPVRWPVLLREPEFDQVRGEFERARDTAVAELKAGGELSSATQTRLTEALAAVRVRLTEMVKPSPEMPWQEVYAFGTAGAYLDSTGKAIQRLAEGGKELADAEALKFNGRSVVELIQHLILRGLKFAPPETGDEATYQKLFHAVRAVYLKTAKTNEAK